VRPWPWPERGRGGGGVFFTGSGDSVPACLPAVAPEQGCGARPPRFLHRRPPLPHAHPCQRGDEAGATPPTHIVRSAAVSPSSASQIREVARTDARPPPAPRARRLLVLPASASSCCPPADRSRRSPSRAPDASRATRRRGEAGTRHELLLPWIWRIGTRRRIHHGRPPVFLESSSLAWSSSSSWSSSSCSGSRCRGRHGRRRDAQRRDGDDCGGWGDAAAARPWWGQWGMKEPLDPLRSRGDVGFERHRCSGFSFKSQRFLLQKPTGKGQRPFEGERCGWSKSVTPSLALSMCP
jgi:hypothetical protein